MTKIDLRKTLRKITDPQDVRLKLSQNLFNSVQSIKPISTLFLYHALGEEIPVDSLRQLGVPCALPRMITDTTMQFFLWQSELIQDPKTGIYQPHPQCEVAIPDDTSVIIVPGLGFNQQGFRIGRGRGYYDRYLKEHPEGLRIGVCSEARIVDFKEESFDIAVHKIQTESRIFSC